MIVNNLSLRIPGGVEDDCAIVGSITQNNIPVLEDNYVKKMNANNGFSEKRMFRKIASIPVAAALKAAQDGYNLDEKQDLYKFLEENKDYMSVDYILSPRHSQIIVK
jgi:hypothetical protein